MRLLSDAEIEHVSGGDGEVADVVVTGTRLYNDSWSGDFPMFTYSYYGGGDFSGFGDGGGGGGGAADTPPTEHHADNLSEQQKEHAHQAIDTAIGAIKDAVKQYGNDLKVQLPDKSVITAAEAIEDLSKLNDAISAGLLVDGLISGDKGLKDAAGFLAGLGAVALAGEAVPGVVAALIGIAADNIVQAGVEQVQVVYGAAVDTLNKAVEQGVENGTIPPYDPSHPDYFFDDLFGTPRPEYRFYDGETPVQYQQAY